MARSKSHSIEDVFLESQYSRQGFLKDIFEENSTELWQKASEQKEPWAILHQNNQEHIDGCGDNPKLISRKAKLAKLRAKQNSILIVSNQEQIINDQCQLLTNTEISHTGNPKHALELLKKSSYSLIVIEYQLPLANGIQLLNSFSAHVGTIEVPVVLISTEKLDKTVKDSAIKLGTKLVLESPFESSLLAACIQRIIEKTNDQ